MIVPECKTCESFIRIKHYTNFQHTGYGVGCSRVTDDWCAMDPSRCGNYEPVGPSKATLRVADIISSVLLWAGLVYVVCFVIRWVLK